MYFPDSLFSLACGAALVLVVPGPTNTLLLSSGLNVGARKTFPLVFAEAMGYLLAISLWGLFLIALAKTWPAFVGAVKLGCAAYIVFLAVNIWAQSALVSTSRVVVVDYRTLFLATLMNPKALIFASTVFPPEAFDSTRHLVEAFAAFFIVLAPIGMAWSCLGGLLTSRESLARHTTTLMRAASLLLLVFASLLTYSVFRR